jgi:hypothetical protein
VPGLADLAEQRQALKPLQDEAKELNQQLLKAMPEFRRAVTDLPGLQEVAAQRAKVRIEQRALRKGIENPGTAEARKIELRTQFGALTNRFAQLDEELNKLTASTLEAKKAVIEREKILKLLGDNREKQEPFDTAIKSRGENMQLWQEMGGLGGRIVLALLLLAAIRRGALLRLFLVPGLFVFPLTYLYLFREQPSLFHIGIAAAGFLTVAQFSYFGEYLPKVFPLHLRGTGGSFATNVGGRMFGTSAAFVTTNLIAPHLTGTPFEQVATGAAIMGTTVFVIGLAVSFLLPEPPKEGMKD